MICCDTGGVVLGKDACVHVYEQRRRSHRGIIGFQLRDTGVVGWAQVSAKSRSGCEGFMGCSVLSLAVGIRSV